MQSSSRRAFLRGRRLPATGWESFCQRAAQAVSGRFQVLSEKDGACSARLVPGAAGDVHHARALCAQYGVVLLLDGVDHGATRSGAPVLWVEPGMEVGSCERLESGSPKWFVQPGCTLGRLAERQLPGFGQMPFHMNVASWLADRSMCDWPTGRTLLSGVTHMSVLLSDGNSVVLGPFGAQEQQPLTPALRRLVSGLFQLSAGPQAQACRQLAQWPCRYRLDALTPPDEQGINLSHLMLGHGGRLGWIEWVVLDERLLGTQADVPTSGREWLGAREVGLRAQAEALDGQVKSLFDEMALYPG
ncbi:hypothetical protein [Paracandidimonas soli]|uniref:hypothetical protein n=1 Tax=Paracandidimonas soli TaxID=1917182 RepID=UPI00334070E7